MRIVLIRFHVFLYFFQISFGILPLDILGHLIFPLLSFADTLRYEVLPNDAPSFTLLTQYDASQIWCYVEENQHSDVVCTEET
jgi:hypothetical protein